MGENNRKRPLNAQLFIIRTWPEPIADEQVEWRGQIHHTVSGISHYFRDWEQFGYLLEEIFFDLAEEGE